MANHILLVDDESDVLLVLKDLFGSRGDQVSSASNGKEASELLETISPDLILADYQMPEMNGIELLREARASSPDAMRILLTAHGDLNVAIEAINVADVYKFITKPCNNNDLLLTV